MTRKPTKIDSDRRRRTFPIDDNSQTDREERLRMRERDADARSRATTAREHLVAQREAQLAAREGMLTERERLMQRLRDTNDKLVAAITRAREMAEAAEVAHTTALANEERFRSLVTTSAALVWQADASGAIRVGLANWEAFTGIGAEATEGQWGWLLSVHPDDRQRVGDAWSQALTTSTPYVCQHRLHHHDGTYISVLSRAVPIIRSGVVREWIGMMTDVSQQVSIEEAREQFIGILGHDLRNPLGAIMVGAHLLASAPAPYTKIVAQIVRSGRRMEAIIRDVMDFARGRLGGGIPVVVAECDLQRLCVDVVAEIVQAHPDRDIRCETAGDLRGECDRDRVEQALSNLIGNAIAHGSDPIEVRACGERDHLVISVRNQGDPIPAARLPGLFEPFSQGPRDDHTRLTRGLGLGLYIVREIARAHGGTITASSEPGAGTLFTLRLPRRAAAA